MRAFFKHVGARRKSRVTIGDREFHYSEAFNDSTLTTVATTPQRSGASAATAAALSSPASPSRAAAASTGSQPRPSRTRVCVSLVVFVCLFVCLLFLFLLWLLLLLLLFLYELLADESVRCCCSDNAEAAHVGLAAKFAKLE